MRRDTKSILAAHRIDPSRVELYVEGARDKAFLDWLVPHTERSNANIVLVSTIEIESVTEGGERERVLTFLDSVEREGINVRGLVDADLARFGDASTPSNACPSNAWLTDLRDLEAYVLSEENVRTALQLGFGRDASLSPAIHSSMVTVGRYVAATRLASQSLGLDLPFSAQRWTRYVTADRFGVVRLDEAGFLRSLVQSSGNSLQILDALEELIGKYTTNLASLDDGEVVHGKDAFALLGKQFGAVGANATDVSPVLWTTFRKDELARFPTLRAVTNYLRR